jgi:uroporphyrinogen-III synthase
MIAIRDVPDTAPVEAWLRRFADGTCDDLVLMTGEGLRRLLGFARRIDLASSHFGNDSDHARIVNF